MSKLLERLLQNGYYPKHIFDIGANVGEWTQIALQFFNQSKYYLFEANQYPQLEQFKSYPQQFKVFNEILFEKSGNVDWYENHSTGDSIFVELTSFYKDIQPIQRYAKTLNELVPEIYEPFDQFDSLFIKIDCQGSEIPILRGASFFYDKADFILLELPFFGQYNKKALNFLEHIQFMDKIGFIVYDISQIHMIHEFVMQIDILFINKKHPFNQLVQERLLQSK